MKIVSLYLEITYLNSW